MDWHVVYEELERLVLLEEGRLELILTSEHTYYVHITVFGEQDKTVITKDFSSKVVTLELARAAFVRKCRGASRTITL